MNILFLTSRFPTDENHFTLEKELVYAFNKDGHHCIVANILERKYKKKSYISYIDASDHSRLKSNITILNIKTGNLFNDVGPFEKRFTAASLALIFPGKIQKLLSTINKQEIDYIIAYGPYLCSSNIIKPLKKSFNAKAILMQWDIFPQNAYDLGIIKNNLIFKYFKHKQKQMLSLYDLIVCNSKGNIHYFKRYFFKETLHKLFLFHNCESLRLKLSHDNNQEINLTVKSKIRQKYNIPSEATTLIFGGNIGIPQALENIVQLANKINNSHIQFIIIGQGTEAFRIKTLCDKTQNIQFFDYIPSQEYEELLQVCDYGIISLSPKFSVPNFPAKVSSYLKLGLPIFAYLDDCSYNDLGQFIINNKIGYAINTNYTIDAEHIAKQLMDKPALQQFNKNTQNVFNEVFNINHTFKDLIHRLKDI